MTQKCLVITDRGRFALSQGPALNKQRSRKEKKMICLISTSNKYVPVRTAYWHINGKHEGTHSISNAKERRKKNETISRNWIETMATISQKKEQLINEPKKQIWCKKKELNTSNLRAIT